jgi:hypothetical protein
VTADMTADEQNARVHALLVALDRGLADIGLGLDAAIGWSDGRFTGGTLEISERADDAPTYPPSPLPSAVAVARRLVASTEHEAQHPQDPGGLPDIEMCWDELGRIDAALIAWHAECDKVGIPHDPEILVRHHRGNAELAGAITGAEIALSVLISFYKQIAIHARVVMDTAEGRHQHRRVVVAYTQLADTYADRLAVFGLRNATVLHDARAEIDEALLAAGTEHPDGDVPGANG